MLDPTTEIRTATLPDRSTRITELSKMLADLFPDPGSELSRRHAALILKVKTSFDVPQRGAYHNEGSFMDSHLYIILKCIEDVRLGNFPAIVPTAVREILSKARTEYGDAVKRYTFLHDITKQDTLTIKFSDGRAVPYNWREWTGLLSETETGRRAIAGDEAALQKFCEDADISEISYYQQVGAGVKLQHGDTGAAWILDNGLITDAPTIAAIRNHEVAYQFTSINVSTYDKYFGSLSPSERGYALLASYADTMASYQKLSSGGGAAPDLTAFLYLAESMLKAESMAKAFTSILKQMGALDDVISTNLSRYRNSTNPLRDLEEIFGSIAGASYSAGRLAQEFIRVRNSSDPFTLEKVPEFVSKLLASVKAKSYNLGLLRAQMERDFSDLPADKREEMLGLVNTDRKAALASVTTLLGRRMAKFMQMLADCEA